MRKKLFPKNKAHPEQAEFFRRFWAVAVDAVLVTVLAILLYGLFTEVASKLGGEPGMFTKAARAIREGKTVVIALSSELEEDEDHYYIPGEDESFDILRELVIGYIYFILFFHFWGRTPGKRLLRLKVIDLKERSRLGWYQAFERTHGYAASLLIGGLGFLQVLWDSGGLTMHDKLAGTTVVKVPQKKKKKKRKKTVPKDAPEESNSTV